MNYITVLRALRYDLNIVANAVANKDKPIGRELHRICAELSHVIRHMHDAVAEKPKAESKPQSDLPIGMIEPQYEQDVTVAITSALTKLMREEFAKRRKAKEEITDFQTRVAECHLRLQQAISGLPDPTPVEKEIAEKPATLLGGMLDSFQRCKNGYYLAGYKYHTENSYAKELFSSLVFNCEASKQNFDRFVNLAMAHICRYKKIDAQIDAEPYRLELRKLHFLGYYELLPLSVKMAAYAQMYLVDEKGYKDVIERQIVLDPSAYSTPLDVMDLVTIVRALLKGSFDPYKSDHRYNAALSYVRERLTDFDF